MTGAEDDLMRPHRLRGAVVTTALVTLTLGALASCGYDDGKGPGQSPTAQTSASLTDPSGAATSSDPTDAAATPSPSTDDTYEKDTAAAVEKATIVAERAVKNYSTWSWREPTWQPWLNRMRPLVTDAFEQTLAETFTGGESWSDLVVGPRLTSTTTVLGSQVQRGTTPNPGSVVLVVKSQPKVSAGDAPAEGQDVREYVVYVTLADHGRRWLVNDITAPNTTQG